MTFASEICLAMGFGAAAAFLACALFGVGRRSDDAEAARQCELLLKGSRDLNRAYREENARLQAELSELNSLRRDGGSYPRRSLQ